MATPYIRDPEDPVAQLVESYAPMRLGQLLYLEATFVEVVPLVEIRPGSPAGDQVSASSGITFTVAAWAGRGDVVGRTVVRADNSIVGTVASFDPPTGAITLTAAPTGTVGGDVFLQALANNGQPAWRRAQKGKRWTVNVPLGDPAGLQYVLGRQIASLVEGTRAMLNQLGNTTYTDTQLQAAAQELAGAGVVQDTFLADAAAQIDADRRAGTLPPSATVTFTP